MFVRDAVRRLLNNQFLSELDYSEIKKLLMKEYGFNNIPLSPIPASTNDIPSANKSDNQIKIEKIYSPHNINALYDKTSLQFALDGLTVIYGKNGSGKSSFSKILKKLCWSRDKNVVLKKNVYKEDNSLQTVKIKFYEGGNENEYVWFEDSPLDQRLNSVFVFDSKCADVYLNKENPAEYKPAGIDILERLALLFNKISQEIDNEVLHLNKVKFNLPSKYNQTLIARWFQNIENLDKIAIENKLIITDEQKEVKNTLEKSLKDSNIVETNKTLKHKKERYEKLQASLKVIEMLFTEDSIRKIRELKEDVDIKEQAYRTACISFNTDNEFSIGSEAWRVLWNAARNYAISDLHKSYPILSNEKGNFCALCQQPLSEDAENRLQKFDLYIQDTTSIALEQAKKKLDETGKKYTSIISSNIIPSDIKSELIEDNSDYSNMINEYILKVQVAQKNILTFINNEEIKLELSNLPKSFAAILLTEINKIDKIIKKNEEIIESRAKMEVELLELEALSILVENKTEILNYYDELIVKRKYSTCKNALNTRGISNKIGEILESKAIASQHVIFVDYLRRMNPFLANKMVLRKTKTTSGITYQKCSFNSISEKIVDILSEGEQKIVALANFLSECTIDNNDNCIIFDDPINSLDIDYREIVAKIIVELSGVRQTIVMTHDLYFLRLLKDIYKNTYSKDCYVTCINAVNGNSGVVSDEIPFLAKNVQERINSITSGLDKIKGMDISQIDEKRVILNDLKDKMRQLIERTVEDILVNKTISRFSKNINFKKGNLANIIVVCKTDVDYLLSLYAKYSEIIHDGSIETIPNLISEEDIQKDISEYKLWKDKFLQNVKDWKNINGYNV